MVKPGAEVRAGVSFVAPVTAIDEFADTSRKPVAERNAADSQSVEN